MHRLGASLRAVPSGSEGFGKCSSGGAGATLCRPRKARRVDRTDQGEPWMGGGDNLEVLSWQP